MTAPTFLSRSARVHLTPWAAAKIEQADYDALEQRAAELDVNVTTILRSDRSWMVRVGKDGTVTSLVAKGSLAAIIAGALDDWAAA